MSRLKKTGWFGAGASGLVALAVATVGQHEGLRLKAYRDIVGVPTVCYGETRGVRMGQSYSKPACDAMLAKALDEFGDRIEACVPGLKTAPDGTYVAALSMAYNVGAGGFCGSTTARLFRAGQWQAGCSAMRAWNKAGGRVVLGLVRRRAEEVKLCTRGLP